MENQLPSIVELLAAAALSRHHPPLTQALDFEGRSPADVAEAAGHMEAAQALQRTQNLLRDLVAVRPAAALARQLVTAEGLGDGSQSGATAVKEAAGEQQGGDRQLVRVDGSHAAVSTEEIACILQEAAAAGDVQPLLSLLAADAAGSDGHTALHAAAMAGQAAAVRALVEAGARVSTTRADGISPIQLAAAEGHVVVLRELLRAGASVSEADNEGDTVLSFAARGGHVKALRTLLAVESVSPSPRNLQGVTPLHWAATLGQTAAL